MTHPPHPLGRLAALRAELACLGVDAFLVPRGDAFLGEYVSPSAERLAWLSGFTGSAGLALVLRERAVIFIDGRYTTQAEAECDPATWERHHLIEHPPATFLKECAPGLRLGYDPWLHTEASLARLTDAGALLVPLADNPIDRLWHDRPAPPAAPAEAHALAFAGEASSAKRAAAAAVLRQEGQRAALLADPHSVAWLFNLRGRDLAYTPLLLARALLRDDASAVLFLHPDRADAGLLAHLGPEVALHPPDSMAEILAGCTGWPVRIDPDLTPAALAVLLREAGATPVPGDDPCRLPRACKNAVEQNGARAAHHRDALALVRFLAWFAERAPQGGLGEVSAAVHLLDLRAEAPEFVSESFPAISGAGPNGAIIHYRATAATDRPIGAEEAYLIDSGAQYRDGTTDVTRTLWTGPGAAPEDLRARYTMVLRGHLTLSALRFPAGIAGPHMDALARAPLWQAGLDYDHGTGHGIGSFLSVHEGPAGISRAAKPVPFKPGMIVSNEPGFYLPGAYGIRIENLLLVSAAALCPGQTKPFLEFETLTLAPYARALIDAAALSPAERRQVDSYHARVLAALAPKLPADAVAWLARECAPL